MSAVDELLLDEQRAEAQRTSYLSLAAARPSSKRTNHRAKLKHHQRNGDRASPDDDDDAPRLTTFVRFNDLVAANIVRSWPSLMRLIRTQQFPQGKMIGAHSRAWALAEVEKWLAQRPVANVDVRLRGKKAAEADA